MQGIENKLLTLKLNKFWKVVDTSLVGDALVDLAAGKNSYALDIDYPVLDDGNPDLTATPTIRPVDWAEWITLPIRSWDFSIKTIKMEIRVPTILVAKNYEKIPKIKFGKKPTSDQIRIRDGNRCQYTGQLLKKEDISIDHILPKSLGGQDTWENQVVTSKKLNSEKSNRRNEELGLKLIRPAVKPKEMLRSQLIRDALHPDWKLFMKTSDN